MGVGGGGAETGGRRRGSGTAPRLDPGAGDGAGVAAGPRRRRQGLGRAGRRVWTGRAGQDRRDLGRGLGKIKGKQSYTVGPSPQPAVMGLYTAGSCYQPAVMVGDLITAGSCYQPKVMMDITAGPNGIRR